MAGYKKESVNEIFRKINSLSELSDKAKYENDELTTTYSISFDENGKEIKTRVKTFNELLYEAIGINKLNVKFKKLDERAVIPTYAHEGDVGMDLTAIEVEYNSDMDCYLYHTGLAFETDKHYGIFLFPRSSNRKTEAYLCNHVGIADSAIYRGEIILCFKNRTSLRQNAFEGRMIEFWNAIEDGKSIEDATKESVHGWMEAMKNPMLFAPYKVGDRVAQMVVLPYPDVNLEEAEKLSNTDRGDGGFGSTNK